MKKIFAVFVVTTVLVLTTLLFGGQADPTGTWVGPMPVAEAGIELQLTLTLENKDGQLTGRLKDDMGYIDCEIADAVLEDTALTFTAAAQTPDGAFDLNFNMRIDGETMAGTWEIPGMATGDWTAEKQK